MTTRPYLFTFWSSPEPAPAYIRLCRETVFKNLASSFEIVDLTLENCGDWLPERDRLWHFSKPLNKGRSYSLDARRIAQFTGMLRVGLLARYGGLWLDADHIAFPSFAFLAPLVTSRDIVAPEDADSHLSNPVLGARPGSEFAASLWSKVLENLDEKEQAGEIGARWGEQGFRLLNQVWRETRPQLPFVAPYGTLISFDTGISQDIFAPDSGQIDRIPPLALGLSVFNNSLGTDIRCLSETVLRESGSVFSLALKVALDGDDTLANWLMIQTPEQLSALDRSSTVGRLLEAEADHWNALSKLKTRLANRSDKIEQLSTANRKLRKNLAAVRDREN